jgi:hypothetical protein
VRDHVNRAGVEDGQDDDVTRRPGAVRADGGSVADLVGERLRLGVVSRLMISTVWPCAAAREPMAVAMLPAPMMLMVVMPVATGGCLPLFPVG